MKRILIINPFGIGDVLFTTPVIRTLKQAYPDAFIGYWSNQRVEAILKNEPLIDKVFALSRGDLKKICRESFFKGIVYAVKLIREIKKARFDICLDFSLDHRYSLWAKIIGIKERIGFNYKGRGRFLTAKLDIDGYQDKHAAEYYSSLLNFLQIPAGTPELFLTVKPVDEIKAKNILAAAGVRTDDCVVGIFPGAGGSWGKDAQIKHWPADKFAQVADRLIDRFGAKVLILGDASEQMIAQTIARIMVNQPIDLAGKIGLEILAAIIKNCNLLITNDGGPMHMGVALGIKSVSVFGPVSEVVYGPYPISREHLVLKYDLECRPCYKNFRLAHCQRDKECLKQVTVDAVFDAAVKLLT